VYILQGAMRKYQPLPQPWSAIYDRLVRHGVTCDAEVISMYSAQSSAVL
jgi:hypothetical protein